MLTTTTTTTHRTKCTRQNIVSEMKETLSDDLAPTARCGARASGDGDCGRTRRDDWQQILHACHAAVEWDSDGGITRITLIIAECASRVIGPCLCAVIGDVVVAHAPHIIAQHLCNSRRRPGGEKTALGCVPHTSSLCPTANMF